MEISLNHIKLPSKYTKPFKWYGGKGILVKKLLNYLPKTKIYCEPFCGSATLFWALPKFYRIGVINDINEEIVNFFRCMQNPETYKELKHRIIWTPYSRAEFERAINYKGEDKAEKAWSFYVKINQSFNGVPNPTVGKWGRCFVSSGDKAKFCRDWRMRMKLLEYWHDRLTSVQIDCRDAIEVIRYWDTENTFFFVDPPYLKETRTCNDGYKDEVSLDYYKNLVDVLLEVKGKVMLCGYKHKIHDKLEQNGWIRKDFNISVGSSGKSRFREGVNRKRIESIWMNYKIKKSIFEQQ